jgi:hypothetical protein
MLCVRDVPVFLGLLGLPAVSFWGVSWGGMVTTLLSAGVLGLIVVVGILRMAFRSPFSSKRLSFCVLLVASEVGLVFAAVRFGQSHFRSSVIGRLDEYGAVVAATTKRLESSSRSRVTVRSPHPDFVLAEAVREPDGKVTVRLLFEHAPRRSPLYFAPNHSLPKQRGPSCLQRLEDAWYWYGPC